MCDVDVVGLGVGVAPEWDTPIDTSRYQYEYMVAQARHYCCFSVLFPLFIISFDFSVFHIMCMSCLSDPVRCLPGFVTTEFSSLSRIGTDTGCIDIDG